MKTLALLTVLAAPALVAAQVVNKPKLALRNYATGFAEPVAIAHCGDDRLFVVERAGVIRIVSDSMTVEPEPFLNISGPVNSGGGEQGLLGLAFDPEYTTNGYFYLYYIAGTGNGYSRVSRMQVSANPDSADVSTEVPLYQWVQPYSNHNGGDIHFGPDGYLYIGFGDGGSGNDPEENGQDLSEPLGDMVRIDVSQHNDSFLIPATNPWQNNGDTLPEVWASGLRNPFRWSFDRLNGDLWIGDVGQNAWEEVDRWPGGDNSGPNFGWRCREGFVATPGISDPTCGSAADYVSPVAAFNHTSQGWCSVIGGYVYRGDWYPHHYGHYIFTDYCAGDFLTFSDDTYTDVDTMLMTGSFGYAAFGEDAAGQLYVADQQNGVLKKIYDPCPMADPTISFDGYQFSTEAGTAYQWFLNGAAITGADEAVYIPQVSGNYQVRVNFGTPCNLFSDTLVFIATGIERIDQVGLRVYPQPAKERFTMERAALEATLSMRITDALGRVVNSLPWSAGSHLLEVDVTALSPGTYVISGITADGSEEIRTAILVAR